MAESRSFRTSREAARGVWMSMARAWSTFLPRMWSITRRALRGAVRTYFARADRDVGRGLASRPPLRLLGAARCDLRSAAPAARGGLRLSGLVLGRGLAICLGRLGLGLLLVGL